MAKKKSSASFNLAKALGIKKKRKTKLSSKLKPSNILGVPKLKRKIAKATGVPTTKQGRKNKLKRLFHLK